MNRTKIVYSRYIYSKNGEYFEMHREGLHEQMDNVKCILNLPGLCLVLWQTYRFIYVNV